MGQYDAYPVQFDNENARFLFQSIGKRGIFDKAVFITPVAPDVQNLALLDYDPATNDYSDQPITDNGDMAEVIATVISIIKRFLDSNPGQKIYFEGNTPARTRLYQIAISKVYDPEHSDLLISGYKNNHWTSFEPNVSFEGFLIEKKF
jgi:hypothetical protein